MNPAKQFDKMPIEDRRKPRVKLSLSPLSHRSVGTQRFNSSIASTNISKVSYRSPHDSIEMPSTLKDAPRKFEFPQINEKSLHSIPFMHSRKQSLNNIPSSERESHFKSHRSSSQVQLSGLLQPSPTFLPKIHHHKHCQDSVESPSPGQSKPFRRSSDIIGSFLASYEQLQQSSTGNDKSDPEDFLRMAVKEQDKAAKAILRNNFKLDHYKKIIKQIILDLVSEKRTFETKILVQTFEIGTSNNDYRQAFFERRKQMITKPLEACQKILTHLKQLQIAFSTNRSKKVLDEGFTKLLPLTRESQNPEIHLQSLKIWAKICRERRDIYKAEQLFKLHKHMSNIYRSFDSKIRSYKHLGIIAQGKLKHSTALSNFIKMLQLAWLTNNKDLELKSYDLIGVQYFYMNMLEKAMYYHDRAMLGKIEPKNSDFRNLGVSRAVHKLPKGALDPEAAGGRHRFDKIDSAFYMNDNAFASSDEEEDLPLPKEFDAMMQKIETTQRLTQMQMNLALVKSGKIQEKVRREVNIGEIFKDRRRESFDGKGLENLKLRLNQKSVIGAAFQEMSSKMLITHLTPNRVVSNFFNAEGKLIPMEKEIVEDVIDPKTSRRAIRWLIKFQKTLELVRNTLERFKWNDKFQSFSFDNSEFESLKNVKSPH